MSTKKTKTKSQPKPKPRITYKLTLEFHDAPEDTTAGCKMFLMIRPLIEALGFKNCVQMSVDKIVSCEHEVFHSETCGHEMPMILKN